MTDALATLTNIERAQAAERKARAAMKQWQAATDDKTRANTARQMAMHWQAAAFFWSKATIGK